MSNMQKPMLADPQNKAGEGVPNQGESPDHGRVRGTDAGHGAAAEPTGGSLLARSGPAKPQYRTSLFRR